MDAHVPQRAGLGGMMALPEAPGAEMPARNPLRDFGLRVFLWLPACFALWFGFATLLTLPLVVAINAAFTSVFGELIHSIERAADGAAGVALAIVTRLPVAELGPGAVLQIDLRLLPYGYGLPLFAALTMAAPMSASRRMRQILLALLVVMLIQLWGVFWEFCKQLAFSAGPQGAEVVQRLGLEPNLIALCYQLGSLILPAVVPVVLWLAVNRDFIEMMVRPQEPGAPGRGLQGPQE